MGVVYLIRVLKPNPKAQFKWGRSAKSWYLKERLRIPPPMKKDELFAFLYQHIKADIPCKVSIIRNSTFREERGFKSVLYGRMTRTNFEIIRGPRGGPHAIHQSEHKVIPGIGREEEYHPLPY